MPICLRRQHNAPAGKEAGYGTGIAPIQCTVNDIILCTHDPILVKSLYGLLRDEGHDVEIADHLSLAVQMVLKQEYSAVIMDARTFGLSAAEAVRIIKVVSPEVQVVLIGSDDHETGVFCMKGPADLEELKHVVHALQGMSRESHN